MPIDPSHGHANLAVATNTSFGATANIVCVEDYVPSADVITCLTSGQWGRATCLPTSTYTQPVKSLNGNAYLGLYEVFLS